jgi:GntR family transcriptional repressor for pyruvate dehydrogenase complex
MLGTARWPWYDSAPDVAVGLKGNVCRDGSDMAKSIQKSGVRLQPMSRTTLSGTLFEKLVGHVVKGDWKEGERIPSEREISGQLGIGRASLREALKALELLGMVESRVGDGTFVCPRSDFLSRPLLWAIMGADQSELRQLIEARLVIEESIAAFTAVRATAEELKKIKAALEEMRAQIEDPSRSFEGDMRFHIAIGEAAHNPILSNADQLMRNLMKQWILLKHNIPGAAARSLEHHARIYDAILHRDADRAREEMRNHIATTGRVVIEFVTHR